MIATVLLAVAGSRAPASGQISFNDFCDVSSLTLNGVTGTLTPNAGCVLRLVDSYVQSGSAFTTQAFSLAADASFSTSFCFRITDPAGASDLDGVGADGIAFVVQTQANTAGGNGGSLGYGGIAPSLAIEFDTYQNGHDPDGNHVGLDLNGDVMSVTTAPVATRLNDGAVFCAWVDYDGVAGSIEARLSDTGMRPATPLVSATVDLPALLGTTDAFVGFSAGTGSGTGVHDILSWQLVGSYAPIACGNGTLDPGEVCDDGNTVSGDCCDTTCQIAATVGTPCPSDGNACTEDVCDGTGQCGSAISCDDGIPCTQDSCVPASGCVHAHAPSGGCRGAGKSLLLLKHDASDDTKDKLTWKWLKGAETVRDDFGDPTDMTHHFLCLYAGASSAAIMVPAGSDWQAVGTKGYKYLDLAADPEGAQKLLLKSGAAGKAKALVKGKGANLPDTLVPMLPLPVTAQLVNDTNSTCFEAVYDSGDVIKNDEKQFKAKTP